MARPRDERQKDLLRPALGEIIDLRHPLARLAEKIDWSFLWFERCIPPERTPRAAFPPPERPPISFEATLHWAD